MPNRKLSARARLIKRWRFKYKVLILNENTLEEVFHVRLSRLSVFLYGGLLAAIAFVLISLLILYTPLKFFLPGASDVAIRSQLIAEAARVDSLSQHIYLQKLQVDAMKDIIQGAIPIDSIIPLDSVKLDTWAKISLDKSEREQVFCETFEQEEKYNLGIIEATAKVQSEIFFRPVKGTISTSYNEDNRSYSVVISTIPGEPVMSVLKGVVVMAAYTLSNEYVVGVQHANGYMSVYKNASQLLVEVGDIVNAGEGIAIVGAPDADLSASHIHFELWQNGKSLNPESYIIF